MITRHRRKGSAPLEVVMIFPTLVLLLVAILWIGAGGMARTTALSAARGEGWQQRPTNPGDVTKLEHDPAQTAVRHTENVPVAMSAPGKPVRVATATVVVQDRPWAHEDLSFPALPADQGITVHADLLDQFGRNNAGPVADVSSLVGEFNASRFLDPAASPTRTDSKPVK